MDQPQQLRDVKIGEWKNFPQFTIIPLINVQHKNQDFKKKSLNWSAGNPKKFADQFTMIANSLNQIRSIIGTPQKKRQMFQTYNGTNMKIWDQGSLATSKLVDHKSYPFGIRRNRDVEITMKCVSVN